MNLPPCYSDNHLPALLKQKLSGSLPGTDAHALYQARSLSGNKWPKRKPGPDTRIGAVLILLMKQNDNWHFPLIVRTASKGVHSRQISLPGGGAEANDKSLADTALREAWEEIGTPIENLILLGNLSPLYVFASNYMVTPYVAVLNQTSKTPTPVFVPSPAEVESILLPPLSDLLLPRRTANLKVRGIALEAPYFNLCENIVWGATACILSELTVLLKGKL